jgi:hypothetical protein
VGARLFTLSQAGIKASALATLADEGFVPFPQPPQTQPAQPVSSPPTG